MASSVAPAVHLAQYAALRSCFGLLHSFGVEENLRTAAGFGRLYASLVPRHRQRAMDNLAHAMPHLSDDERRALAVRSLESMFQLFMVESVATPRLVTPTSWTRHVSFAPPHRLLQRGLGLLLALGAGVGAVLAVAGDVEDRPQFPLQLEGLAHQLFRAGVVVDRGQDGEGLFAREEHGFWMAHGGSTGKQKAAAFYRGLSGKLSDLPDYSMSLTASASSVSSLSVRFIFSRL